MKIDKSTFCVAPWFQIRNENNMTKKVCCVIQNDTDDKSKDMSPLEYLNTPDIQKLKKDLTLGIKNPKCKNCWHSEKYGMKSQRNHLNGILTNDNFEKNSWIGSYIKHKKDFVSDFILMADIKIGNTCNHACVMCKPCDSSLIYNDWTKRKDSEFVQEVLKKDPNYMETSKWSTFKNTKYDNYLSDVLEKNKVRFLKILGGEPFLDKNLLQKLSELHDDIKKNLSLHIVTNGSIDLESTINFLGAFKDISLSISLEGIEEVQEWARYGSNWAQLEKNIINARDKKIATISIQHTIQAPTLMGIKRLFEWCGKNNIPLSCYALKDPYYLSISAFPTHIKKQIMDNIEKNKNLLKVETTDNQISYDYERLIELLQDTKFDIEHHRKFLRYIDWYEINKDIPKLETIFPQLYQVNQIDEKS